MMSPMQLFLSMLHAAKLSLQVPVKTNLKDPHGINKDSFFDYIEKRHLSVTLIILLVQMLLLVFSTSVQVPLAPDLN